MGRKKGLSGAVGKGGVNPAPVEGALTVRMAAEQLLAVPIDDLVPYANNARVHSKAQIAQIRASLREFGFVTPVLIDFENNIIAGHGRVEAARAEGMTEVPCVLVSNLTDAQRKAYILADNQMSEIGAWDPLKLKLELEGLEALSFDMRIAGFDAAAIETLTFASPPAPEKPGGGGCLQPDRAGDGGTVEVDETDEYRQFVDKFKHKLTADDCYTPENIYQCVRDWAIRHYNLEGAQVLRPFYPGGDYQCTDYPEDCVVIDNPPFSILSAICRWYNERDIRYFLFAPTLTLFSTAAGSCNYVLTGIPVTYENGASINTSFVTNLGPWKIEIDPNLYQQVKQANDETRRETANALPEYVYPPDVITSAAYDLAKRGQLLQIRAEDCVFTRVLDAQKAVGKAIFGSGFLLSERAAAERMAAERMAADSLTPIEWELSERERQLVRELGQTLK